MQGESYNMDLIAHYGYFPIVFLTMKF